MSESEYFSRRQILKALGLTAVAGGVGWKLLTQGESLQAEDDNTDNPYSKYFPADRHENFQKVERDISNEDAVLGYNNYYEFSTDKKRVKKLAQKLEMSPWEIEVAGLCEKPGTYDIHDLIQKDDQEERVYRFRCVETWSMVVPWTGIPLSKVLQLFKPKSEAKYVRFYSVLQKDNMPGTRFAFKGMWPYYEGLRMDEAMNELTLFCTGIFGKPLPPQCGGPARIIVPWKYGYKSPKSIAKIEFVKEQPPTFWEDAAPKEYPFESNVDPSRPHPRWSQAMEHDIPKGKKRKTVLYNGYGKYVADLYK